MKFQLANSNSERALLKKIDFLFSSRNLNAYAIWELTFWILFSVDSDYYYIINVKYQYVIQVYARISRFCDHHYNHVRIISFSFSLSLL